MVMCSIAQKIGLTSMTIKNCVVLNVKDLLNKHDP